ncbi:MAG: FAD-dependent oxidoreductase, partial [Clostridia bacterium]|nr:FAD-dependent oxidoreductase [Clostridia bacterium]
MCILATLLVAPAMTDGMKPSTYTGIAKAMLDGLTVDVMVSETAIEKVEVVSHNETSPGGRRRHDGFHQACRGSAEAAVRYSPVMSSFEVPQTWDETYDVVIVGGGFAGMAAAYASGEAGASTVLVEKLSNTGGNSAINGGQYATYTSSRASELEQRFNLVPDTAQKHIEDTIAGGDEMND